MTNTRLSPVARAPRCVVAGLLLAASMFVLAGCTWFDPPKEVTAEAEVLAEKIGEITGITAVDVDVWGRDFKDHPNDWIFVFSITAADAGSLDSVAPAVRKIANRASVYAVTVALEVPAARSIAPVVLRNLDETTVQAAAALRALPEVAAVDIGSSYPGTTVDKSPGATLAETAASLRTVPGFGADASLSGVDPIHSITIQWEGSRQDSLHAVEIGVSGPSVPVLNTLEHLGADSSVNQINALEGEMWGLPPERPAIEVEMDRPADGVPVLAGTADPAAEAGIRPRTAFRVSTGTMGTTPSAEPDGYVGLPLGADEPLDLPSPPVLPDPTTADQALVDFPPDEWVPSTDPAVLARLDTLTAEVENLLHNAGALAGVTADFTTNVGPCEWPDVGTHITAYVVLPVFEVADSADDAFASIVGDWERSGLARSDRALGLDIYSNPLADAVIAMATIRGTSEGINISVTSQCVRVG